MRPSSPSKGFLLLVDTDEDLARQLAAALDIRHELKATDIPAYSRHLIAEVSRAAGDGRQRAARPLPA
jgi:hypothetical protein